MLHNLMFVSLIGCDNGCHLQESVVILVSTSSLALLHVEPPGAAV
jgi:hypothetical protein